MSETTIRGGADAVAIETSEHGVRIALGLGGVDASVMLDFGEARLLAETILSQLEVLLEVVLEVAAERQIPVGIWRIVQDDDGVEFQELSRREHHLALMANPPLWPIRDRLFVKRVSDGDLEVGFLRPERGPSIWDRSDLVASFESFEAMFDAGWKVD